MDFLVYSICFGVGLLFAIISAFLGHLFGGHDAHVDLGTGGHAEAGFEDTGMPGLSPFSPTTVSSFITAFGALGLILSRIEATKSPWISAPLATLGGLIIAEYEEPVLHDRPTSPGATLTGTERIRSSACRNRRSPGRTAASGLS